MPVESYASEKEYLAALESRSALPEGFRCGTAPIRFFPRERAVAEPLAMNLSLIALEEPTASFAGVFTRNRFPGAPVLLGRERLARTSDPRRAREQQDLERLHRRAGARTRRSSSRAWAR